jgi:hypothetical protein
MFRIMILEKVMKSYVIELDICSFSCLFPTLIYIKFFSTV